MMYQIVYKTEAENDLLDILTYYHEQGGWELVQQIEQRIHQHISKLQTFPYRTRESEVFENTREYIVEKLPYKAFLRIDEHEKQVIILNIVHFARRFPD